MQGRLQGKHIQARHFLDVVLRSGTEAQSYLLATDVEMNTVDGYALASWDTGYGNMLMRPDATTMRRVPWHPGTVLAICDLELVNGEPVSVSPRQILRRQQAELDVHGWRAMVGSELEFLVFRDSYRQAWAQGYRDIEAVSQYGIDYSILDTQGTEPLLRRADGGPRGCWRWALVRHVRGEPRPA